MSAAPGIEAPTIAAIGGVHLAVTDLDRAMAFWTHVLGLELLDDRDRLMRLGAGGDELVVLRPGATRPVARGVTGLYHVAIHLPARGDLARAVARLRSYSYLNSPTDHLVTETTYLADPDGIGIELTFATPERGEFVVVDGTYGARDPDGNMHSGRDPLDLASLLAELAPGDDLATGFPAGTCIGHVHLHVADLDMAMRFYRDTLGLQELMFIPQIGMGDVTMPGYVPHLIAFNTWAGEGAPRPPADAAGLQHFTLRLPSADALERLVTRIARDSPMPAEVEGALQVEDPSGTRIRLEHA